MCLGAPAINEMNKCVINDMFEVDMDPLLYCHLDRSGEGFVFVDANSTRFLTN
jgi:hypothetical protein